MAFTCENISWEKAEFLVKMVEETNFTVESVMRSSLAMSYLAKWELGIIHQRRLQIYLEPMIK